MNVAIVKYNAGNIYSVVNALKRLGITPELTDDAERFSKADRVLFPGQGEAGSTMAYLRSRGLDRLIRDLKQPVLGICIGQQLMCSHSEGLFRHFRHESPEVPSGKARRQSAPHGMEHLDTYKQPAVQRPRHGRIRLFRTQLLRAGQPVHHSRDRLCRAVQCRLA